MPMQPAHEMHYFTRTCFHYFNQLYFHILLLRLLCMFPPSFLEIERKTQSGLIWNETGAFLSKSLKSASNVHGIKYSLPRKIKIKLIGRGFD